MDVRGPVHRADYECVMADPNRNAGFEPTDPSFSQATSSISSAAGSSSGRSAPDFAAIDFEVDFKGRATEAELTPLGQMQMGF